MFWRRKIPNRSQLYDPLSRTGLVPNRLTFEIRIGKEKKQEKENQ